jgi:hypothetical protein
MVGVRLDGTKELIALADGYRESTESWAEVLRDVKRRGMVAPALAVGDGALGFWGALTEAFPETRQQRCWCHKSANILDCLPKTVQPGAKRAIFQITNAENKDAAIRAHHAEGLGAALAAAPRRGGESERDALIHTIGNLTLLTGRLNTKVSNGPWGGLGGKKQGLEAHDVLLLNRELLKGGGAEWTEAAIRSRSEDMSRLIVDIWLVPPGHRSGFSQDKAGHAPMRRIDLADLLGAGRLEAGGTLFARRKKSLSGP